MFSLNLECKMTKNYVVWMSNRIGIDTKKDPDLVFISYLYCFEILGRKMGNKSNFNFFLTKGPIFLQTLKS